MIYTWLQTLSAQKICVEQLLAYRRECGEHHAVESWSHWSWQSPCFPDHTGVVLIWTSRRREQAHKTVTERTLLGITEWSTVTKFSNVPEDKVPQEKFSVSTH